jgi:hypothetical protein
MIDKITKKKVPKKRRAGKGREETSSPPSRLGQKSSRRQTT